MITITYTNGNKQIITPGGSFYATVVEKKYGNTWKQIKLAPAEWRKHMLDVAEDIAWDSQWFPYRGAFISHVSIHAPNDQFVERTFNPLIIKEEHVPRAASYKKEQRRLRKKYKNDPRPKTFMHYGVSLN